MSSLEFAYLCSTSRIESRSVRIAFVLRIAINPLRRASCFAQAWVAILGNPRNACVTPMEAPGETFCAFAILHRAESL
jgi:hypothetical protein